MASHYGIPRLRVRSMWSTSHFAQDSIEVAERRTSTRTLVSPPIYASLDNINGGLIFNMTEEGLALTAAMTLSGEGRLGLRIYLPDSGGWIEATGQIAWRSETGKTVGVRIIGLSEEVRQRIRKWLAEETSRGELLPEAVRLPDPGECPSDSVVAEAPIVPLEALLNSNTLAERRMLAAILSEDPVASLDPPAKVLVDPPLQLTRVTDEDANYGDSSPEFRQRRVHQRSQIRPFSYIELGGDNGGMLLDISEGGFAVATAECVTGDGFPSIKIQFTGSMDRIEASGQIAWISESKRKAGIRFVKLTEEARRTIASRISREESPGEFHGQSSNVPVNPVVHVEFPKDAVLGDASSEIVVQEHLRPSAPPRLAMPGVPRGNIQPTVAAPDALPLKLWNRSEFKPKPRPAIRPVTPKERTERLRWIAAAIILVVATGATVGWIEVSPVVRNTANVFNPQNTKSANEPAQVQKSRPAATSANASAPRSENTGSQAPEFGLVPADRSVNRSETRRVLERPQMANKARSAAPPAFNGAVGRHVSPPPKNPPVSPSQHAVVPATNPAPDSAGRQAVENSSTQPAGSTAIPATSAPMSLHVDPASTVIKEKESSPSPVKQPEVPVSVTWSVAVSGDPYPSIRIPPDISSQKASRGRSLQIGRATSHAEPVYPEEAKRQGVEGTVKLHVVVGRDGAVQSVEPMSGPALLTKAATSAVREWRYSQTLLGGQPVETEQDIVVKFRLESASISKN